MDLQKNISSEFRRLAQKLLNTVPKIYNASASKFAANGLQTIFYQGAPYKGNETRVFAYMGIPQNATPEHKVPAMVLVHGGLGRAEASWVQKWVSKGYAAIAMDMEGHTPDRQKHPFSGPENDKYDTALPTEDLWIFHATANIIYANNILRSNPCIDADKIGITGISWGGVNTATAIGIDNRFAFAIPVYGCGYLFEATTYFSTIMTPEKAFLDPSEFFKAAQMPILWVNTDHDPHFPLSITAKSYAATKNHGYITINPQISHSQADGETTPEIYTFADSMVKQGNAFVKITEVSVSDNVLRAKTLFPPNVTVAQATLCFTTDEEFEYESDVPGAPMKTVWTYKNNGVAKANTVEFNIPHTAKWAYAIITDSNGNRVATPLLAV